MKNLNYLFDELEEAVTNGFIDNLSISHCENDIHFISFGIVHKENQNLIMKENLLKYICNQIEPEYYIEVESPWNKKQFKAILRYNNF